MYKLSGIVYCLRGCSNDIARAVGGGVGVTYSKFIEFIPIVISISFGFVQSQPFEEFFLEQF